jgi:hypothetical protein
MPDPSRHRFWRVFPWDPAAGPGAPFSPEYVVPAERQTRGRFDLGTTPVLYLAESPEHAVAEMLRPFTGRPLQRPHLLGAGRQLALVGVDLAPAVVTRLADLTDPAILLRYSIHPDALASRSRATTQAISRSLFDEGLSGFRWWSALHGDWHALLIFLSRVEGGEIAHASPEHLTPEHPAVTAAALELKME